jgi:AraC family transcriptional regulator
MPGEDALRMKPVTLASYKERVLRVLVHIQRHLDDDVSLDQLAEIACFSQYHFHRIFHGMVGESVKEHVRRLRLERAAQRLRFSGQPITGIALDAGYEAHEAFTRAFRQMFTESPQEYRKRHRRVAYGPSRSGVHFAENGVVEDFNPVQSNEHLEVRLENFPDTLVAFVRHTGPYNDVGVAWRALMAWAGRRGLLGPGMRLIGLVHDDPDVTAPEHVRYDAAVVIAQPAEPEGDVGVQEIEGGSFAVARHQGPYETLGATYARLCGEWAPRAGHELRSAPALEAYLNWPGMTTPNGLLTDVYVPLIV